MSVTSALERLSVSVGSNIFIVSAPNKVPANLFVSCAFQKPTGSLVGSVNRSFYYTLSFTASRFACFTRQNQSHLRRHCRYGILLPSMITALCFRIVSFFVAILAKNEMSPAFRMLTCHIGILLLHPILMI